LEATIHKTGAINQYNIYIPNLGIQAINPFEKLQLDIEYLSRMAISGPSGSGSGCVNNNLGASSGGNEPAHFVRLKKIF